LEVLLKFIFELNILSKGNLSNGKNCCISYCLYNEIDDKFKMIGTIQYRTFMPRYLI